MPVPLQQSRANDEGSDKTASVVADEKEQGIPPPTTPGIRAAAELASTVVRPRLCDR